MKGIVKLTLTKTFEYDLSKEEGFDEDTMREALQDLVDAGMTANASDIKMAVESILQDDCLNEKDKIEASDFKIEVEDGAEVEMPEDEADAEEK